MKDSEAQPTPASELAGARLPTYRRLWRNTVILTSLVALAPLWVLSVVNYHLDIDAMRRENELGVLRILTNTKQSIQSVLGRKRSALTLVATEYTYAQLSDPDRLRVVLRNLNSSFEGFVDLGVIGPGGQQHSYSGPYPLQGKNYYNQRWFLDVIIMGKHVSDVFMGYRHFPHIVIAVKHEQPDGGFYVLRATVSVDLLGGAVRLARTDRNTDVFVTNREGVLQTESAFFGQILAPSGVELPPHCCPPERVEGYHDGDHWTTRGFASIDESPFVLVAIKKSPDPLKEWLAHRSRMLWFTLFSSAVILAVILYGSTNTIRRLKRADRRRVKVLHNIEYTAKLATIGRMAAGVAHEINNPLAIINESAGLLKDTIDYGAEFPQQEKALRLLESILGSVKRCSGVTRRLLGFARRMDTSRETVVLEHLVREVVGFQRTEAAHRNIEVRYDFEPDLPSIDSDRGQLQQVFLNIISNAFAAVDDGGHIDIEGTRARDGEVLVTIRDNGRGISKENLQHVFQPFFSTKGEFGTGLGLSITQDIVHRLGGRIEVESTLGEGTSFHVTLPEGGETPGETDGH